MTCLDGEFYSEKDEQLKTNIQHKINIKKLEVFFDYCLIIVFSSFKLFGSGSRNKVCLSNYIVFLQAQCPSWCACWASLLAGARSPCWSGSTRACSGPLSAPWSSRILWPSTGPTRHSSPVWPSACPTTVGLIVHTGQRHSVLFQPMWRFRGILIRNRMPLFIFFEFGSKLNCFKIKVHLNFLSVNN